MTSNKKILPISTYDKIQLLRAVHAIAETSFEVCIPIEHDIKFRILRKYFNMKYTTNLENSCEFSSVTIDHSKPLTSIGAINRPLIFPKSIVDYCKSIWENKRIYRFSFVGLVTNNRKQVIESWVKKNFDSAFLIPEKNLFLKLVNKIIKKITKSNSSKIKKIGDFVFWSSNRGRIFPVKSWDNQYYTILSRSQFVLCPNGDFIWSYRFFESILCGAIPIIQDECDAYNEFKFYKISDDINNFVWTEEVAMHNYLLCIERITIPIDELNTEVDRLINIKNSIKE